MTIVDKIEKITTERYIQSARKINEYEVFIYALAVVTVNFKGDDNDYCFDLKTGCSTDSIGRPANCFGLYADDDSSGYDDPTRLTAALVRCERLRNEQIIRLSMGGTLNCDDELQDLNKLCKHVKTMNDVELLCDVINYACPSFSRDDLSIDGYEFFCKWVNKPSKKLQSIDTKFILR